MKTFKKTTLQLIHVNVWQNPLKCCEVISLQLIKINEKKNEIKLKKKRKPRYMNIFWLLITLYFHIFNHFVFSYIISLVTQLSTLCDPMDCSMPGFPVHHQLPELVQTHVNQVGDAIQPSHPLSSPSPPALNLSQHQDLLQWVSSSHQVAKVLEFQLQCQSFQWIFRTDFLQDGLVGSPGIPRDSQESSPTPQFKSINSLALSFLYSPTLTSIHDYWKNHSFD